MSSTPRRRQPWAAAMLEGVRQYIDRLRIDGYSIGDNHDDDPVLIDSAGRAVDTWRESYPYAERMSREDYEEAKYLLQVELLKFQNWAADTRTKHLFAVRGAVSQTRPSSNAAETQSATNRCLAI